MPVLACTTLIMINKYCLDIDECANGLHDCQNDISSCKKTPYCYECNCITGYRNKLNTNICEGNEILLFSSTTCIFLCSDVNECQSGSHTCNIDTSTCVNTKGSFTCECQNGFEKVGGVCLGNLSLSFLLHNMRHRYYFIFIILHIDIITY